MGFLNILIAIAIGIVIWKVAMWFVVMLATPPSEIDPEDVVRVEQDYRCTICGTEVTMTVMNVGEESAPKHCREEMVPVWTP